MKKYIKLVLKKILPVFVINALNGVKVKIINKIYPEYSDAFLDSLSELLKEDKYSGVSNLIQKSVGCKRTVKEMVRLLRLRNTDLKRYAIEYDACLARFSNRKCSYYNYQKWQFLKVSCVALGLFRLSLVFEKKAVENVLSQQKVSRRNLLPLFNACMETGDYKRAKAALEAISQFITKLEYEVLYNYFSIIVYGVSDKLFLTDSYSKYMHGKDVVILGPATNLVDFERGFFVDRVVVRNNFFEETSDEQLVHTDVSYYNTEVFNRLYKETFFGTMHNCLFYCIKNKDSYQRLDSKIKETSHLQPQIYGLFMFSSPYMLPIMLMDLLFTGVKTIVVHGNTLYLGDVIANKNYINSYNAGKVNHWIEFASHGLVDNFLFIKCLYERKFFETDAFFASVLDCSVDEYLSKMEQKWVLN